MFHWVTGIPFQNDLHGGAYDELTMWEQIDDGAQYTPAKKWLLSVPIVLWVTPIAHPQLLTMLVDFSSPRTTLITILGCLRSTSRHSSLLSYPSYPRCAAQQQCHERVL